MPRENLGGLTFDGQLTPKTEYDNGNSGSGTVTIDWNKGNRQKITMTGNCTFAAPTNMKAGTVYSLRLIEDATGNRAPTWNAVFIWLAGSAPTLGGANQVDLIAFYCDGVNLLGSTGTGVGGSSYTDEQAQDAVLNLLAADTGDIDFTYDDATPALSASIKSSVISSAGRALIDDADAAAMRTTLGGLQTPCTNIGTADLDVANSETVIVSKQFAANELSAGMTFMFKAFATRTGTQSAAFIVRIRIGTTTLTGNIAATLTAVADGLATPLEIEGLVTIRTAGSGGTALGSLRTMRHLGAVTVTPFISPSTATVAVNTTSADQKIELTIISGHANNHYIFRNAVIFRVN